MGELREASLTISPQPGGGLVQLEVARQLQEETIPAHLTLRVCVCGGGDGDGGGGSGGRGRTCESHSGPLLPGPLSFFCFLNSNKLFSRKKGDASILRK